MGIRYSFCLVALVFLVDSLYSHATCLSDKKGICSSVIRPVVCACPCMRYKLVGERLMCVKCGHFRGFLPVTVE